jgi:hypothetical protein
MLISEQKPLEEILSYLEGDKNIFLIGCKGCAEGWGSGGEKQVAEMKSTLQEKGKTVIGSVVVDMLCDSALTKLKLRAYKKEIAAADSILVLTDGAGVQTVLMQSGKKRSAALSVVIVCWSLLVDSVPLPDVLSICSMVPVAAHKVVNVKSIQIYLAFGNRLSIVLPN